MKIRTLACRSLLSVLSLAFATTMLPSCVSEGAYLAKEDEASYNRQRAQDAEAKAKAERERAEYYRRQNSKPAPKKVSGDFEPVR